MRRAPFALVALATTLAAGCAGDEAADARTGQIELFLARDMQVLAVSRPRQLELRFAEMAASPFRFLRGTEALYTRDMRDPALPFAQTRLTAPPLVLLQGDAHLENVGTFVGGRVELNDFDAAGYGPPWWEVRRAGAALLVGLREAAPGVVDEGAVVARLASAYASALVAGERAGLGVADVGAVIGKRLTSAAKDGPARSELADYTTVTPAGRRLVRGGTNATDPREALLEVPLAVQDALPAAITRYRSTLWSDSFSAGHFTLKDAARRCGQGVGSLTAVRFYALLEGPTVADDDDVLVQLKETDDASFDVDLSYGASGPSQAARVVDRQRRLQSTPDADPLLGHTRLLDLPIAVSSVTGFQKTVRVSDLAGRTADDVLRFAADVGTVLARSQARGLTVDGDAAWPALATWLTGHESAFVAESVSAARAYADQVVADHARFVQLRASRGPGLGLTLRTNTDDVPRDDPARAVLDPPCP